MPHFNFNGKLFPAGSPVIGASSRGLRYGDGLFETIKCLNGRLILADEHLARLWKGMGIMKFEVPRHLSPERLQDEIQSLVWKNGHERMARIRLTVFRGEGGLYDALNHFPNYIIETWALPETTGLNSNGLVLGIYPDVNKSVDILSNLKHNNYLPYVMAALYAKEQHWNDAIILNSLGNICDCTIANVFLIKEGRIITPALEEGCVAGVMRKAVIRELTVGSWQLVEKQVTVQDLLEADEVFLSNSIYDMRWVQRVGNSTYNNTVTLQIYRLLLPTIS